MTVQISTEHNGTIEISTSTIGGEAAVTIQSSVDTVFLLPAEARTLSAALDQERSRVFAKHDRTAGGAW